MTVQLNPAIAELDPQSLCHTIYSQLYQNFFNAQDAGTLSEGDATSVRLHNTAYDFAAAIAGAVAGDGETGTGGVLLEYLRKSGGAMTGPLRARYGFEAGVGNTGILELFAEPVRDDDGSLLRTDCGVRITGDVLLGGRSLLFDGHRAVSYDKMDAQLRLDAAQIDMGAATTTTVGDVIIGEDKERGLHLSPAAIRLHGHNVYHAGNANLPDADWTMRDAAVAGNLSVSGATEHTGFFRALQGAELGAAGATVAVLYPGVLALAGDLSFGVGCGIRMNGQDVLIRSGEKDIMLGGIGGDLLLGGAGTGMVRLLSGIGDLDGEHLLLSPYGAACFPASLVVRHNYGDELLSSYRVDDADEGMVIHKRLRFGTKEGCFLRGTSTGLEFVTQMEHITDGGIRSAAHTTHLFHRPSTSRYAALNGASDSFVISTDADFVTVDAPLEARGHVGIDGSPTRLADGRLDLAEGHYLLDVADGIRHFGAAYFCAGIGSETFTSGFVGTGWAVQRSRTTGNVTATFDEVVVRRRLRVYEMEVQRTRATDGSLWISDSCSGDSVERV